MKCYHLLSISFLVLTQEEMFESLPVTDNSADNDNDNDNNNKNNDHHDAGDDDENRNMIIIKTKPNSDKTVSIIAPIDTIRKAINRHIVNCYHFCPTTAPLIIAEVIIFTINITVIVIPQHLITNGKIFSGGNRSSQIIQIRALHHFH